MTVVFKDATQIIGEHVRTTLGATVVSKVPSNRDKTAEFVRIQRVGGVRTGIVTDDATLAVEAWAATKEAAHDLLQRVRAVIGEMPHTRTTATPIYRVVEFAGPAYLPDPESSHERFTYTVSVALRGADSVTLTT